MKTDLEKAYVPSCDACQCNKSSTKRPPGPLHPLPLADKCGDTVSIDFIGPLPEDAGFNSLCTITDQLGSDMRLIPCHTDMTAEKFARLFFDYWYCENGLCLNIISDCDHLFVSKFWNVLHKLSGVKLKMSTSFHPQTDGLSERTNKTVVQALCFYVGRTQKGWVQVLPRVRFEIMNTINASTGYSPFQLLQGRSPHLIPPLAPLAADDSLLPEDERARALIQQLETDIADACDSLVLAKVNQARHANKHRGKEDAYAVGDYVMLATFHRRRDYMQKGDGRVAKFMPRYDGKYRVIAAFPDRSTYRLELPNSHGKFATFHSSQLKRYIENDPFAFPGHELSRPPPIVMENGMEEWEVESIIEHRRRGRGYQYLVHW